MSRLVKAAGVATLAVLAAGPVIQPATDTNPAAYNTGDTSELIAALPVTKFAEMPEARRIVYCVDLGAVTAAGDLIYADADFEVTNDLNYNLLFASQVVLTDSCANPAGMEIAEGNGYNCDPVMHHCVVSRSGVLVVPPGISRRYVTVAAWSTTTKTAWQPGDALIVQPDYGRLSVLWWRS